MERGSGVPDGSLSRLPHEGRFEADASAMPGKDEDDPLSHLALAYRRFWRRLPPSLADCVDIDSQVAEIEAIAKQLEEEHKHTASRRWRDWTSSSLKDGGGKSLQVDKEDRATGATRDC